MIILRGDIMLDLQTAIDLMKKYGYTSTSVYPYIYKTDTNVGICYSFVDDHYGILERVAIFRTSQEMDDFLKKYQYSDTFILCLT